MKGTTLNSGLLDLLPHLSQFLYLIGKVRALSYLLVLEHLLYELGHVQVADELVLVQVGSLVLNDLPQFPLLLESHLVQNLLNHA